MDTYSLCLYIIPLFNFSDFFKNFNLHLSDCTSLVVFSRLGLESVQCEYADLSSECYILIIYIPTYIDTYIMDIYVNRR